MVNLMSYDKQTLKAVPVRRRSAARLAAVQITYQLVELFSAQLTGARSMDRGLASFRNVLFVVGTSAAVLSFEGIGLACIDLCLTIDRLRATEGGLLRIVRRALLVSMLSMVAEMIGMTLVTVLGDFDVRSFDTDLYVVQLAFVEVHVLLTFAAFVRASRWFGRLTSEGGYRASGGWPEATRKSLQAVMWLVRRVKTWLAIWVIIIFLWFVSFYFRLAVFEWLMSAVATALIAAAARDTCGLVEGTLRSTTATIVAASRWEMRQRVSVGSRGSEATPLQLFRQYANKRLTLNPIQAASAA